MTKKRSIEVLNSDKEDLFEGLFRSPHKKSVSMQENFPDYESWSNSVAAVESLLGRSSHFENLHKIIVGDLLKGDVIFLYLPGRDSSTCSQWFTRILIILR